MTRWLVPVLLVIIAGLQYRLWVGEGSVAHLRSLEQEITLQKAENQRLLDRNRILEAEVNQVRDTRDGHENLEGIEEHARSQMGMVKEGETFFLIIDSE